MKPIKVKITNEDMLQPPFGLFTNRIAVVVGYICNGSYEEAILVLKDGRFITATLKNIVMYNTEQLVLW